MKKVGNVVILIMFLLSSVNISAKDVKADVPVVPLDTSVDTPCTEDINCTSLNSACGTATCNTGTGFCQLAFMPNTTICGTTPGACGASQFCTGDSVTCPSEDTFQQAGVVCINETSCMNAAVCTGDSTICNLPVAKLDGTTCTLDDKCLLTPTCLLGSCIGTPTECADNFTCTVDACDPSTGDCVFAPDDSVCSDNKFCNGLETCNPSTPGADQNTGCLQGTPSDCSGNNLPAISTCDKTPDAIPFTLDTAAPVNSTCSEGADQAICSTPTQDIFHTCNMATCGAQCETAANCPNTCANNMFSSQGSCAAGCICDYQTQDCTALNGWYNTTNTRLINISECSQMQQDEQIFETFTCDTTNGCMNTTTDSRWIDTSITSNKPDNTLCDDGNFCTVSDVCTAGDCGGSPRDCSANNINVNECNYNPDNLPVTLDQFSFTSTCDEDAMACTTAPGNWQDTISHTCNTATCGAKCESSNNCPDHCDTTNPDIFWLGFCDKGCACQFAYEDCSQLTGWWLAGNATWEDTSQCTQKEVQPLEFRQYSCTDAQPAGCQYIITNTTAEDTDNTRNKENGVSCDDGLFCTVNDNCQEGVCVTSPRDCSANSINIAQCNNNPDDISTTFDQFTFTSTCDDNAKECTTAPEGYQSQITHTCSISECGAQCETSADCAPKCDGLTYLSAGSCTGECSCSYAASKSCSFTSGWYATGNTRFNSTGQCTEQQQIEQQFRVAKCDALAGGCGYDIAQTRWLFNGTARNIADQTACNDGLFCTTGDFCMTGVCQTGPTPTDCSANNIAPVDSCTNVPDSNQFTLDTAAGFTSVCDEIAKACTTGTQDVVSVCNKETCGAECVTSPDCVAECNGNIFESQGSCTAGCTCNFVEEDCAAKSGWFNTTVTQFVNDTACTEKEQMQQEFREYTCALPDGCSFNVTDTRFIDTGNVRNKQEGLVCDDHSLCSTDSTCQSGVCVPGQEKVCTSDISCVTGQCNPSTGECDFTADNALCTGGTFCGGGQVCDLTLGCVAGTPVDCSGNNFPAINTCDNDPDNIHFTLDTATGFTSACDENAKACTTETQVIAHTCDIATCGAECAINADCTDRCEGSVFESAGSCTAGCTCNFESGLDCSLQNGWYDTDVTQLVDAAACTQMQQQQQEFRVYTCSITGCEFTVNETRFIDTNITLNKPDTTPCETGSFCLSGGTCQTGACVGTPRDCSDGISCTADSCNDELEQCVHTTNDSVCNDGLFCDGVETCNSATGCVAGTAVDCSIHDLPAISQCNNDPDALPLTLDVAAGFTSVCDETLKECTLGHYDFTHTCDVATCGAECDPTHECANKCVGTVFNSAGDCTTGCACEYQTTDCALQNGWYDTDVTQLVDISSCQQMQQQQQEFRVYACSLTGCSFTVNETRFIDTNITSNKPDNTACETGSFCLSGGTCQAGVCQGTERDCSDGIACTVDDCSNELQQCTHTTDNSLCTGGTFCGGGQVCDLTLGCMGGTAVDCSANNLPAIDSCTNDPDNNPFTLDSRPAFVSVCDNNAEACTVGAQQVTSTCNKQACGAQCESAADCAPKCEGSVFMDSGSCTAGCTCNYQETDCSLKNGWYNTTNTRTNVTGVCLTKEQKQQEFRVYTCSISGCDFTVNATQWIDISTISVAPDHTACDDGLFCTSDDECETGICAGTQMDCSANNLPSINTCNNVPDSNPFTLDTAAGFTSVCDENTKACTTGTQTVESTCDKLTCGAECAISSDCAPKCSGNVFMTQGSCLAGCTCNYETTDCGALSGWYNTTFPTFVSTGQCTEKQVQQQEFRTYECDAQEGCTFTVTDNRTIDTGVTQDIADGTTCDDSQFCTVIDVCSAGVCAGVANTCSDDVSCTVDSCSDALQQCVHTADNAVCDNGLFCDGQETCSLTLGCQAGTPVDCGADNKAAIETCNNNPDNNPFTLDESNSFTSVCDEQAKACTTINQIVESTCSVTECNAQCDSTNLCADSTCSQTFTDFCEGKTLVEYNTDKILDTTTVTNAAENTCTAGCACTDNQAICNAPSTNSYCAKGVCGADCAIDSDCEAKCVGTVRNFGATCGGCECNFQTEDCAAKDNFYDTNVTKFVDIGMCQEKEQKQQEFRSYSCAPDACTFEVTETRFVDTGLIRPIVGCEVFKIDSPEHKVYQVTSINIGLVSLTNAKITYSIDNGPFKLACTSCTEFNKLTDFALGAHKLAAKALYNDSTVRNDSVQFTVSSPAKVIGGKTIWTGVPTDGNFLISELDIIQTVNFRVPRFPANRQSLVEQVIDTSLVLNAKNLPGLNLNQHFVLFMQDSKTGNLLRLGELTTNGLKPATSNPFDTRIIGHFISQGMIMDTSLLSRFDSALLEVETAGGPSPSGDVVAFYNLPPVNV